MRDKLQMYHRVPVDMNRNLQERLTPAGQVEFVSADTQMSDKQLIEYQLKMLLTPKGKRVALDCIFDIRNPAERAARMSGAMILHMHVQHDHHVVFDREKQMPVLQFEQYCIEQPIDSGGYHFDPSIVRHDDS